MSPGIPLTSDGVVLPLKSEAQVSSLDRFGISPCRIKLPGQYFEDPDEPVVFTSRRVPLDEGRGGVPV